jgi:hypothetical protein
VFEALGDLSTAAGVACDERATRWASRCIFLESWLAKSVFADFAAVAAFFNFVLLGI